jgi:hypothetical protein
MYHEIGGKPVRKDPALVRTPDQFRQDLETLYAAGFLPVNMSDIASNSIDLPAGKSPVVLTFDDARGSQFKLIETDNAMKIDPDCALGIMDCVPQSASGLGDAGGRSSCFQNRKRRWSRSGRSVWEIRNWLTLLSRDGNW